jgi:protein-L-isoaspartate O-methyltransferase
MGAGSGFTSCLASHLVGDDGRIVAVDSDPRALEGARSALAAAGRSNISFVHSNALRLKHAPVDRIFATLGVERIPEQWVAMLAPSGSLGAFILTGAPLEADYVVVDSDGREVRRMEDLINSPYESSEIRHSSSVYGDLLAEQTAFLSVLAGDFPGDQGAV